MPDTLYFHLYSDGGYFEKLDIGGWASVIYHHQDSEDIELQRLSNWQKQTSSLEMELKAAVQALESFDQWWQQHPQHNYHVTLFTDSRILIEGLEQKIERWRQNNWVQKSGNPVKYQSLWERFDALYSHHDVNLQWVKGHSGNLGNSLVDELARNAALQRQLPL